MQFLLMSTLKGSHIACALPSLLYPTVIRRKRLAIYILDNYSILRLQKSGIQTTSGSQHKYIKDLHKFCITGEPLRRTI